MDLKRRFDMKKTPFGKPAGSAGNSSKAIHAVGHALAAAVFLLFTLLGSASTAQTAPTITGIGFTADPTGGREYHTTGDTIVIAVNFSENITVNPAPPYDEDDSAVPTIDLEIGNSIKAVRLYGQYGDFVLFVYTVQRGDTDLDGNFWLLPNSLRLNGATIRNSSGADADLSHVEKSCCGRNVITLTESAVLEILYDATGGNGWTTSTNWKTSESLDMWHGVGTGFGNLVARLFLQNNQISGEIPTELGNLTGLTNLHLSNNQISGEIPTELGNLTGLTKLHLSNNQISGEIPTELGNLTGLTNLHLSNNQISGEIPTELGNLTGLTKLHLSNNQISGEIPTELGNLTGLTNLYLSINQLSGEIPAELGNLTSLRNLSLWSNEISGEIPAELGNLTSLRNLFLWSNEISGEIPAELGNLTSLRSLSLWSNEISGEIPAELEELTELQYLELSKNNLSGTIPAELGELTDLFVLTLDENQLTGSIPTELGNLTGLTKLHLSNNQISGEIPTELGNLTSLQYLYLHENELSGTIPTELGSLQGLFVLTLDENQLTGRIPPELGNLTSLRYLYLHENELSGNVPAQIAELPSLQILYLYTNMLTGAIPLTELEALADANRSPIFLELALWGNDGLTGTELISDELGKRVDRAVLSRLYSENNGSEWHSTEVSRNTPQAWRPFSGDYLLSFDDWYGVDTNEDGRVSGLNLNNNNLAGMIANVLEELEHLETLNLADNPMLSGALPDGLWDLSGLAEVNIRCTGIPTPDTPAFNDWLLDEGTDFAGSECSPTPPDTGQPDPPDTGQPDPPDTGQPDPPGTEQPDPPDTEQPDPPDSDGGRGGCALASENWAEDRSVSGRLNLFLIVSSLLGVSLGGRLRPN